MVFELKLTLMQIVDALLQWCFGKYPLLLSYYMVNSNQKGNAASNFPEMDKQT